MENLPRLVRPQQPGTSDIVPGVKAPRSGHASRHDGRRERRAACGGHNTGRGFGLPFVEGIQGATSCPPGIPRATIPAMVRSAMREVL